MWWLSIHEEIFYFNFNPSRARMSCIHSRYAGIILSYFWVSLSSTVQEASSKSLWEIHTVRKGLRIWKILLHQKPTHTFIPFYHILFDIHLCICCLLVMLDHWLYIQINGRRFNKFMMPGSPPNYEVVHRECGFRMGECFHNSVLK